MDKTFNVSVRDRLAKNLSHLDYVCGNTGYMVRFDFDEEWDVYPIKTARFIESSGEHHDVAVIDNQCEFPQIMNTIRVEVGVYAGDLYTTTPAVIGTRRSILSTGGDRPAVPEDIAYDQMMEAINQDAVRAETAADEAEKAAEEAAEKAQQAFDDQVMIVHVGYNASGTLQADREYEEIFDAVRSGKMVFATNGAVNYTFFEQINRDLVFSNVEYTHLSENNGLFARLLIIGKNNSVNVYARNQAKTPNPFKLKLTGAVSAEYNGSEEVTVEIPDGNGTGLPTGGEPHQMLVTDAEGNAKWEERTHYSESEQGIVFAETTPIAMGSGQFAVMEPIVNQPTAGNVYTIVPSGGEPIESEAFGAEIDGVYMVCIGNPLFVGGENNDLPLAMAFFPESMVDAFDGVTAMIVTNGSDNIPALSVVGTVEKIHKIDPKYLPTMGASFLVNGSALGSVMNLGAVVEDETYTMGQFAFALGGRAQGYMSFSVGESADAEGYESFAHNGLASGDTSFVANGATAKGGGAFAANSSTANGVCSASFGQGEANGDYSFAEGVYTVANARAQHVQGRYNIKDTANKYAHIVGNGTLESKRSNAHTIDWDGNGWFAGTVEGTALILTSPDGSRWQITVDNTGALATAKL